MRKIIVFNNISLDGYFTDSNNDMSWAHTYDPEWIEFTNQNAKGESEFLFGRITYQMMAGFWPTAAAMENFPQVAKTMNESPKIVFSTTLNEVHWKNSALLKSNLIEEVRKIKNQPGRDILIFGSGTIIAQLTNEGLIDEYRVVIHPIILGSGRTMFEGVKQKIKLKQTKHRNFTNGNIFICYEPVLSE